MKKMFSLVKTSLAGLALVGGVYVLMSDSRTKKAKTIMNRAMDDANNILSNKMN